MNASSAVLVALLIQQGLFATMWWLMAMAGLARRASLNWALAVTLVTAGLALVVLRDETPRWLGYGGSSALLFAGFALTWRGVQIFSRQAPTDRGHLAGWLIYCGAVAAAVAYGQAWIVVTVASGPLGYVTLRVAATVQRGLGSEFRTRVAAWCAVPFWLIGALLVLRALLAPLLPQLTGTSAHAPGAGNLASAYTFLGCGLVLNLALVALVCSRMVTRLQRASDHDGLTGLLNRRGVEKRLRAEASRLARYGQPYSMLSIDIDNFKRVNDRHGHPVGDAVLCALGQTLARAGRDVDLAARTGGEEFWIVMPQIDAAGARAVAERIVGAVRALSVPSSSGAVTITVSIGVVTADRPDETVESVMQRLDAALYRAKQAGRDRIELAAAPAVCG